MPTTLAGERSTTMTDMNIEDEKQLGMFRKVTQFPLRWGIETHGGPAFFALGIRDSLLVIFVVAVMYYAATIPSTLNVFSSQSFLILNCIIGGQTLATVSHKLDDTLGIVIIGLISLAVREFCLIPNVITFPVLLGVAGRHLNPTTFPAAPLPSAAQIISLGSLIAPPVISWSTAGLLLLRIMEYIMMWGRATTVAFPVCLYLIASHAALLKATTKCWCSSWVQSTRF
ncbi:hypothetical protein BYT27DRAFT_6692513 [Phlegmacium glaucopus]|nr:hypothetical protein BYT27DRAFT_6692513 [Phlegmacium glaucopus]